MERSQNQATEHSDDLATQIEDDILGGAVHVEAAEVSGYPTYTYQPKNRNKTLPLMNASSMVSELAPLVLYLRHIVTPRGVLIVEEPESHLHPVMQVKLVRQLAALIETGIRVIVTTHSEWILDELSNIVARSKIPSKHARSIDDTDLALDPQQVGV